MLEKNFLSMIKTLSNIDIYVEGEAYKLKTCVNVVEL